MIGLRIIRSKIEYKIFLLAKAQFYAFFPKFIGEKIYQISICYPIFAKRVYPFNFERPVPMPDLPFYISPLAIEEISNVMLNKGIPKEYGLRIGIRGGGCGATFLLGFDKQKESDEIYSIHQIPIYVDKKHLMYVIGITIDFEETQEGRGFTFEKREN